MPSDSPIKLRAIPRTTSATTLLFLLFIPLAIIPPFLVPHAVSAWLLAATSIAILLYAFAFSNFQYLTTPQSLIRKNLFQQDEIPWTDIQAIGTQVIRDKFGPLGTIFTLYTADKSFRPMFRPAQTGDFLRLLEQKSPTAVRIDEDRGILAIPGESPQIRTLVTRHKVRLRRKHRLFVLAALFVYLPVLFFIAFRGFIPREILTAIAVATAGYVLLSWPHWSALKLLRD